MVAVENSDDLLRLASIAYGLGLVGQKHTNDGLVVSKGSEIVKSSGDMDLLSHHSNQVAGITRRMKRGMKSQLQKEGGKAGWMPSCQVHQA